MPTPTYIPLATVTLASADSSIIFDSIPATYRDLIVVTNVTHSSATEIDISWTLNNDSLANYNRVSMTGNGSTTSSFAVANENYAYFLMGSTTRSVGILQIMDYSATDKHKTMLGRGNLTAGRVSATAVRWAKTEAVTRVEALLSAGSFNIGSTFSLYGVN